MAKSIWIDLDNLPHVQIFYPLIERLRHNYQVVLTARDHAFTCERLEQVGLSYLKVGGYYGKHKLLKVWGTFFRALQLIRATAKMRFDLALSHGSRALAIAAKVRGIPLITMFDYEHVSNRLYEMMSDIILIPDPVKELDQFRGKSKYLGYPGFKEELYLNEFRPDPNFKKMLNIEKSKTMVVLRPPASSAHYHNPAADELFQKVISLTEKQDDVAAFLVPRQKAGENFSIDSSNIRVLDQPVSGLDLIYNADLVVGGGGTMNREAALLGVPVYSIFQGAKGTLDSKLEQDGKLVFINHETDLGKVHWRKKNPYVSRSKSDNLVLQFILEIIDNRMDSGKAKGNEISTTLSTL